MWYRAKVLFMKELEILAALIDYGRIVCVKAELLQELPHVAKSFYAQAVHVMVDPRTPAEYLNYQEGDVLAVKACGMMEEGITKVQLEGVLYAREVVIPKQLSFAPLINENEIPDTTKGVQWPPSVLCLLKTGDVMSCTVLNVLLNEEDNRDEMVVAIAFEDIANDLECIAADLPTDCMEQLKNPEFNPSIGDMVAAFSNEFNSWVRSIVLDAGCGHWLVACFDFGFIEEVTEIRYIPSDKKYKKSPALSAECLVTKSLFPREDLFCEGRIERNVTLNAKVLKKKDDCLECEFGPNGDQTFCFVTLSVWSPKLNSSAYATLNDGKLLPDPTLDIVKLTPGCSVKIVSYFESLVIYVQPCDAKSKLLMMELHDGITNFAVKNSALKEVPVKGKKYICQYSGDMKYYRVVVKRIINPAKIHIYYIDFGNEETVTNRKLYELPPEFEKIPSFAVKIELKKEFSNVLSIDARKYLSNLILDNKELVLNYTDGNLKNAELLIHNHSLSDILKEFINS
ncbi:tudor domain-containing protein 1-like [Hetaerina americana]|uniref:tudor domain-containing protein 1-like n=1 Tax=Hetaerina americana TaxID=62018 RepID=UPI003A7F457D